MISKGPLAHIFVQEHSHLAMKLPQEKLFASLSSMAFWFPWDFPKRNFSWSQPHRDIKYWVPPAENPGLFLSPTCSAPVHKNPKEENENPEPLIPLIFWKNKPVVSHWVYYFIWRKTYSQWWKRLISFCMSCKERTAMIRPLNCPLRLISLFIIFPITRQT